MPFSKPSRSTDVLDVRLTASDVLSGIERHLLDERGSQSGDACKKSSSACWTTRLAFPTARFAHFGLQRLPRRRTLLQRFLRCRERP